MEGDVVGSLNQACRIHQTARLLPRVADTSVRCINESAARRIQLSRVCDTITRQMSEGRRMQKKGRQKWERATLFWCRVKRLPPALILPSPLAPKSLPNFKRWIRAPFTQRNGTINNSTVVTNLIVGKHTVI
jgi:hypothetical protein